MVFVVGALGLAGVVAYTSEGDEAWIARYPEYGGPPEHGGFSGDEIIHLAGSFDHGGALGLNASDGSVLWAPDLAGPGHALDSQASPDGSAVFVAARSDGLFAVDTADGALLWSVPGLTPFGWYSVAVSPDGTTVYAAGPGRTAAYDAADGSVDWWISGTTQQVEVSPDGEHLYVALLVQGGIQGVYPIRSLNAATGAVEWTASAGDYPFILSDDGSRIYAVAVGPPEPLGQRVVAINTNDGSLAWTTPYRGDDRAARVAVSDDDSKVFVVGGDASALKAAAATVLDSADGSHIASALAPDASFIARDVANHGSRLYVSGTIDRPHSFDTRMVTLAFDV